MPSDEPIPPEDAFELVGNDIRASIIQCLQEGFRNGARSLSYSSLKSRVGVRDSGRFNYHLQQLVGHFVQKDEEGYRLSYAGRKAASAIAGGTYNESISLEPRSVAGTCFDCGDEALELTYENSEFDISCTTCTESIVHMPFPPGAIASYEPDDIEVAFDRWARSWNRLSSSGVCPECGSRMEISFAEDQGGRAIGNVDVRCTLNCTQCWMNGFLPVGCLLLEYPVVASFYWIHGYDLRSFFLWEFEWALSKEYQEVDESGEVIEIRIPLAGDELRLTVDDSFEVINTEKY